VVHFIANYFAYISFRNQGATCYLNSFLQALTALPDFLDEVMEELPMMSSQLAPLQSLIQARAAGKHEMVYACLKEIHQRFAKEVDNNFKSQFAQQDMDEFLTLYLDKIDSQIKAKRKELEFMESSPTLVENSFCFKDTEQRICNK
jgi:ubiquitin C-terminal hydrolase